VLTTDLGRWFETGDSTYRQWRYYHHNNTVFIRKDNIFECYDSVDQHTFTFNGTTTSTLPPKSIPVDLDLNTESILLQPYRKIYPTLTPLSPSSFSEFVNTLQPWESEIIQETRFPTNIYEFVDQIQNATTVLFTSDGSAPQFVGSFGWMASLPDKTRIAYNKGPAFGSRTTSYRAEAYGMLSVLCLLLRAFEYTSTELSS